MFEVATHYPVIATLLFFKTLLFMSVSVEVCITTNIRLGCHSLQNYSYRMMTMIKDVKMLPNSGMCAAQARVCQPLLEMLVLWGKWAKWPNLDFEWSQRRSKDCSFLFFASFYELDAVDTLWIWCSGAKISHQVPRLTWMRVGELEKIYFL